MREEKKYEVLPGVEIPDIKKIQEAASDFSISEVGDVDIKNVSYEPVFEAHQTAAVSPEELARLQALGVKVAEDEERSKAESRAKMEKIMKNVQAPESIGHLKASHIAQLDEEKRKQLEENMKEANQQQADEEAKNKAREERRQLQQRLLEESREKAAKEAAERAAREAEEKARKEAEEKAAKEAAEKAEREAAEKKAAEIAEREAKVQAAKEAALRTAKEALGKAANKAEVKAAEELEKKEPVRPVWEVKKTTTTLSTEETSAAFKEFLDDNDTF